MNGLTLRLNPSNKRMKKSMGLDPVTFLYESKTGSNKLFAEFLEANNAENQLAVIKKIVESVRETCDTEIMRFLSLAFLNAETKHPVKCFITRHITKNELLEQPFANELAKELKKIALNTYTEYQQYVYIVSKEAACIESFPAGSLAIKIVEIELAEHLKDCLDCCIKTLSEGKLSPTEKNEVYGLCHLTLRLLLYIVQRVSQDNTRSLVSTFDTLRLFIKHLVFDEDSPMDTKSICGILFVTMELLEKGPDAWIRILETTIEDETISSLLQSEAAKLSLYSGIVTVVPVKRIEGHKVEGQNAVVCLTEKIIAVGERSSSESVFVLSVSRSMVQVSRLLGRVTAGPELTGLALGFAWAHVDHYMDSVRHLAGQALTNVVRHCTNLHNKGDDSALETVLTALAAADRSRKGYYVCVTALGAALGAARLARLLPALPQQLLAALAVQPVQASATTALELLLEKQSQESDAATLFAVWVRPLLAAAAASDSALLHVLEKLLAKAVALDEEVLNYMIPYISGSEAGEACSLQTRLLALGAARARGGAALPLLEAAAVDAVDETRQLSLSLLAGWGATPLEPRELRLALRFLRYNINAQSPSFRHLTLASFNKLLKRLEHSYPALLRIGAGGSRYFHFLEDLRELCFSSLMPGANYSRRAVALQLLAWTGEIQLAGYNRQWKEEYVSALLVQLDDGYESNKALALLVLDSAPDHLFQDKNYSVSLDLNSIFRQASSMKPTECVSAAYKLDLVRRKLPKHILKGTEGSTPEPVLFALLTQLLVEARRQLAECRLSVARAARHAPMYGVLHCMGHFMCQVDASAISADESWRALVADMITTCVCGCGAVAAVVNSASPEGHLPMDAGIAADDDGNTGNLVLEDGRPVTSQMVLLCAWRTVKEVSLLLGTIASRLTIEGEGQPHGTLSRRQVALIGRHFTRLLAETKHRGAFEQAYVGFTRLLARLWSCSSPSLHGRPGAWLRALARGVASARGPRSATRRSAGLPFMIQALVTTELQVQGNPKCLHECIATLLRVARATTLDTSTACDDDDNDDDYILHQLDDDKDDDYDKRDFDEAAQDEVNNASNDRTEQCNDSNKTSEDSITKKLIEENDTTKDDPTVKTADIKNPPNSVQCNHSKKSEDCTNPVDESNDSYKDSVIEARTHSVNILRALFRNSMLEESLAGYVGEGLMVALQGFEGDTWMERNSATLLLAALLVRVFGAARGRGDPAPRHNMTGRIFFLRYPQLYDFIKSKLEEGVSRSASQASALCPALAVLARLRVSALEGAGSALRLLRLEPLARAAAASCERAARRLAARAAPPLLPPMPDRVFPHLASMFEILRSPDIKRNYCHGILLQLTRLLDVHAALVPRPGDAEQILRGIQDTYWILEQGTAEMFCYVIADEYVKVINLIIWKFPTFINDEALTTIKGYLDRILFTQKIPPITIGREVCLINCFYLYLVIAHKIPGNVDLKDLVYKGLDHRSYDVVLTALNYLLMLYKQPDEERCDFKQHLSTLTDDTVLVNLRSSSEYIEKLCRILRCNKYLECIQKTLKVLTLEKDTQKYIVGIKKGISTEMSDEDVIEHLFDFIQNEHENVTHIYLESLCDFVTDKLRCGSIADETVLKVLRVIFACSSPENSDSARAAVVGFMQHNFDNLLTSHFDKLTAEEKFELKATLLACLVSLLEDDEASLRQRAADAAAAWLGMKPGLLPAYVAYAIRACLEGGDETEEGGDKTEEGGDNIEDGGRETEEGGAKNSGVGDEDDEDGAMDVFPVAGAVTSLGAARDRAALYVTLALLDFKSEVCMTDEISDEYRVFDQNERYNIFLEESVWSAACADHVAGLCRARGLNPARFVCDLVDDPLYRNTFDKLCNSNVILFRKMINDTHTFKNGVVNPKIDLFISKLC